MAMLEVKSVLNLLGTPVSYPYAVTAGPWIGVTQQRLDNSDVGAPLEQVGWRSCGATRAASRPF